MAGDELPPGDYVVFADESGDHGLSSVDHNYPIFVLAFCVFRQSDYVDAVTPAIQRLKFKYWGHDSVVLHERDIRKPGGPFSFLQIAEKRAAFMAELNGLMESAPFTIIASLIRKSHLNRQYVYPDNPYSISLQFGLERLYMHLNGLGQGNRISRVIVERRGKKEDGELELEFRRICDGQNILNRRLPFDIVMAAKEANLPGMQLADLVARPIGIKALRPDQPNRAYEILEPKIRRSPQGEKSGWGLKIFP